MLAEDKRSLARIGLLVGGGLVLAIVLALIATTLG